MTSRDRTRHHRRRRGALSLALLVSAASMSGAAAAPPGASACSGCHTNAAATMPSLSGRSAADISAVMLAFRAGERPATVMGRIAKGFSDEETRAIAEWFSHAQ